MIKDRTANLKGKIVEVEGIRYQLINGTLCRYADLTLDKGFKIVLGRTGSEGILKDLLNRLLGTNIVHLEYRSNEYPGMTEDDRASRFDVYCRDERGNGFLIEMQNWAQKYFNKRAVYYSSIAVQNQAIEEYRRQKEELGKDWNYDFQPLYVVSFLNFRNWTFEGCERRCNEYIATYRYRDVETGNELGDGTTLVFIDLERFDKTLESCTEIEDLWLYSIKNMAWQNNCPEIVEGTEVEALFRQAELATMTMEQRISYETSIMSRNDMLNSMREAVEAAKEEAEKLGRAIGEAEGREIGIAEGREEGRKEGRKEGKEEGREEGREEVMVTAVNKLLKNGVSIEIIADSLGITIDKAKGYII